MRDVLPLQHGEGLGQDDGERPDSALAVVLRAMKRAVGTEWAEVSATESRASSRGKAV
ncbi:hypothetical protein [Streptomyces sp. Sce081]|uniref:hypothetical protein n=1 Tax=Streptomyces sp. Sce081 TaxID=3349853 RepID=UPI0035F4CA7A